MARKEDEIVRWRRREIPFRDDNGDGDNDDGD
jgi:hypothetical protein